MTTLAEKMKKYRTVHRDECRDCGNRWWFDEEESFVCTTCAKTVGKNSYSERLISRTVCPDSGLERTEVEISFPPRREQP